MLERLTDTAREGGRLPVIALTRRWDLKAKLEAFERGVDDILTVPFSPEEFVARVLAIMLDEYDYQFELGKAKLLRDGSDVLIISTGLMTMRALEAVDWLKSNKIDAAVLHVSTIKPLDEQTILKEAARSGRMVVVAENHSIIGGLGEAVAGVLLRAGVTPVFRQVALPDEYLDAGALPTLHERYGISAEAMARSISTWLGGRLVPKRAVA